MTWWTLRNQHINRAELIVEFYKDGKTLYLHQPYAWGAINIETEDDRQPEVDLKNLDGFNILEFDCDNWSEIKNGVTKKMVFPRDLKL